MVLSVDERTVKMNESTKYQIASLEATLVVLDEMIAGREKDLWHLRNLTEFSKTLEDNIESLAKSIDYLNGKKNGIAHAIEIINESLPLDKVSA